MLLQKGGTDSAADGRLPAEIGSAIDMDQRGFALVLEQITAACIADQRRVFAIERNGYYFSAFTEGHGLAGSQCADLRKAKVQQEQLRTRY